MTYHTTDEDGRVGDYVKLKDYVDDGAAFSSSSGSCGGGSEGWWWSWVKLVVIVGVLTALFFQRVEPFFTDKVIIPIINWERETFSNPMIALIVFGSVAIFPTFLLPSIPSMWVAGMTFGYGYGFLLIIVAVAFGVSIPYFIGSIFYPKIQAWLIKHPKKASIIRLAGEGTWFNQFQAVALIRISPFPYVVYNYGAVASDVTYGPYLLGTLVGMMPEVFFAIYT